MDELKHLFHSLVTISTPHIGIAEKEDDFINKSIGFFTGAKKLASIKELYLEDNEDVRNTFIYNLSEDSGLGAFKNLLLFHSSSDIFCPSYSSRIQTSPLLKYGELYTEMVNHIHGVLKVKNLYRIDICAKLDKSKLINVASKAIPADVLKHRLVADYIAWRLCKL